MLYRQIRGVDFDELISFTDKCPETGVLWELSVFHIKGIAIGLKTPINVRETSFLGEFIGFEDFDRVGRLL